jgi:iron-sulfur cluster assembly protein
MLTITESAANQIREIMSQEENAADTFLRVGVREGGCSGFSYGMGFDTDLKEDDVELDAPSGLKVIVDPNSAKYLYGVVIDYKESMMGGGFTIDNPNAVASCGCGSSFRTKTDEGKVEKCED